MDLLAGVVVGWLIKGPKAPNVTEPICCYSSLRTRARVVAVAMVVGESSCYAASEFATSVGFVVTAAPRRTILAAAAAAAAAVGAAAATTAAAGTATAVDACISAATAATSATSGSSSAITTAVLAQEAS